MLDPPSADIRQHPTEMAPSGTKWVDNKKPIFSVEILSATTVHPLDPSIDQVQYNIFHLNKSRKHSMGHFPSLLGFNIRDSGGLFRGFGRPSDCLMVF